MLGAFVWRMISFAEITYLASFCAAALWAAISVVIALADIAGGRESATAAAVSTRFDRKF